MVHDWDYERAAAYGDALERFAVARDLDIDAPATRDAFDAYEDDAREAWAEDRAEAAREDALLPW